MAGVLYRAILLYLIAGLGTACTPNLTYQLNPAHPASPDDNDLIFSLRNSTILVVPSPTSAKKSSDSTPDPGPSSIENVCKPREGGLENADPLVRCLTTVAVSTVPVSDENHVFSATPNWGTTLTSTAVDADPLMVKTVTVNYKNPAVGIVSTAGAGAVTGFAIGGPLGAAAGGVIGAVGATIMGGPRPIVPEDQDAWKSKLCPSDRKDFAKLERSAPQETAAELFLPIALEYGPPTEGFDCWHLLPRAKPEVIGALSLTGWIYRFQPVSQDETKSLLPPIVTPEWDSTHGNKTLRPPFVKRDEYFKEGQNRTTFPISACRRIEVQITWWEKLKADRLETSKYKVVVADPGYIQPVRLPKSGLITLLPACGGYSSSTMSTSPSTELIDAVIKQVQALKEAQAKYNSK